MRASRLRRKAAAGGHGHGPSMERWLLTYADMITLLMALFIILFSISTINKAKYQSLAHELSQGFDAPEAPNLPRKATAKAKAAADTMPIEDDLRKIKIRMDRYIREHHLQDKVSTELDHKGLIITLLTDKALYDSGSADLRPLTKEIIDEVDTFLKQNSNAIRVEGNTDDVPIATSQYPSNWELSAARATNVVRYLVEHGKLDPNRVSLAGYGQFHPRHPNVSEGSRQLNRRVDIVILSGLLTRVEQGENVQ